MRASSFCCFTVLDCRRCWRGVGGDVAGCRRGVGWSYVSEVGRGRVRRGIDGWRDQWFRVRREVRSVQQGSLGTLRGQGQGQGQEGEYESGVRGAGEGGNREGGCESERVTSEVRSQSPENETLRRERDRAPGWYVFWNTGAGACTGSARGRRGQLPLAAISSGQRLRPCPCQV